MQSGTGHRGGTPPLSELAELLLGQASKLTSPVCKGAQVTCQAAIPFVVPAKHGLVEHILREGQRSYKQRDAFPCGWQSIDTNGMPSIREVHIFKGVLLREWLLLLRRQLLLLMLWQCLLTLQRRILSHGLLSLQQRPIGFREGLLGPRLSSQGCAQVSHQVAEWIVTVLIL